MTAAEDEVTLDSKATAASALNNSAAVANDVSDDASLDDVSDMAGGKIRNIPISVDTPSIDCD